MVITVITFQTNQPTFGVIQGTFGVIQGTFGVIQGTFGVIQGTFGVTQPTNTDKRSLKWLVIAHCRVVLLRDSLLVTKI
jgi:hypothetical protein